MPTDVATSGAVHTSIIAQIGGVDGRQKLLPCGEPRARASVSGNADLVTCSGCKAALEGK